MGIKKLIFFSFYKYNRYFPINRGKASISQLLNKIFGAFWIEFDSKTKLELFINSSMDLSYLDQKNESHNVTIAEINTLKPGNIFIDIGANIGFLSIVASKKVGANGKVISIEPSYREYKRLIDNITENGITNILAYNCAMGDHNGSINLKVDKFHTGLNKIFEGDIKSLDPKYFINVPIFKLDYLIDEHPINLIKIDVEGAEFQVLKGMENLLKKKLVDKIVIEITPKFLKEFGSTKEDIYLLLSKYGYSPRFNCNDWQYDEIFE